MKEDLDHTTAMELYKEHILEHFKHPDNFGKLESAEREYLGVNSNCGDEITIQLNTQDGKISDIKFHGKGCAISVASASLVTSKVKGMGVNEVMNMKKEDILELLQIPISAVRLKCALLPLETLHKTIGGEKNE